MQPFKIPYLASLCRNYHNHPDRLIGISRFGYMETYTVREQHITGKLWQCELFKTTLNHFVERRHTLTQVTPLKQRQIDTISTDQLPTIAIATNILRQLESSPELHEVQLTEQQLINTICERTQSIEQSHTDLLELTQKLCDRFKDYLAIPLGAARFESSLLDYLHHLSDYFHEFENTDSSTHRGTTKQNQALQLLQQIIREQMKRAGERLAAVTASKQNTPDAAAATGSIQPSSSQPSSTKEANPESAPGSDSIHQHKPGSSATSIPSQQPSRPAGTRVQYLRDGAQLRRHLHQLPQNIRLPQSVLESMNEHDGMIELIARLAPCSFRDNELLARQIRTAAAYLGVLPSSRSFYLWPDDLAWLIESGHLDYKETGLFRGRFVPHNRISWAAVRLRTLIEQTRSDRGD